MKAVDAQKVIKGLQKPFLCSENAIELENGYVIVKKKYFEELKKLKERDIPKKLKNKVLVRMLDGAPFTFRGECPVCGCKRIQANQTDFCFACGQRFDWGNFDDCIREECKDDNSII